MVDAQTTILYLVIGSMFVINRLGGPQEAYYRIFRKPYFIDYIRGPDKRYRRRLFPMTDIFGTPSQHKYGNGSYGLPEGEAATSASGAPMWFHQYDEFRCIPQYMDTVVDEETGESITKFREKMPPSVICDGFESKTVADIQRDTQPVEKNFPMWIMATGIIVIVILIAGIMWYDYNTTCAVHSAACVATATGH